MLKPWNAPRVSPRFLALNQGFSPERDATNVGGITANVLQGLFQEYCLACVCIYIRDGAPDD